MEQNSSMNPHEISITVKTQYLPDQSELDNRQFVFAYTVTIRNTGSASIQLIARHWFITDGDNDVQEVRGLGVVGQQPLLRSGEHFEYTSWARYQPQRERCVENIFALRKTHSSFRPRYQNSLS
jgi:ApaG protein